ncbi:uncharacterized protein LAESUDRAFT_727624 [Laetiporus sulphureus 93-53]|uniref:Multifunctional tryptophan biosynthesis protein n=1 Tax=Laetiporus sulphureus 93-53 TaxID=1314785 RepID=A0A165DF28_9APHY|nr:uncharacterized protein LAESUDRAFT_727624 [Laetiporus sulphureus 93-53]KZT04750.1 hypothetical protein LAESUDRAFT_727624 [Laetiporus sulphureus 93-53]
MSLSPELNRPLDVLLIDNFDSFTWNLYQSLCLLGADVTVIRNDAISPDVFPLLKINSLIISPGPGHPRTDSGISRDAISFFAGKVPVLGVCMGLECVVDIFGGEIAYAGEIKHGKTSPIAHDARGIFLDVPQNIASTRYHSLSASIASLPPCLAVTATTAESGVIMGVRHRELTIEAVQYHPESVMSEGGDSLLGNFLKLRGGRWADAANQWARVESDEKANGDVNAASTSSAAAAATAASKVPTILEKIYAQRMRDVDLAKRTPGSTPSDLSAQLSLSLAPPLVSFPARLRSAAPAPALMAEIKRASPSKGDIALSANAAQQALSYALAGARIISVLTEPTWFKGSLEDMRAARMAVDALSERPAILRKDFIFDEYQIREARVWGADTVLLIVAMLSEERLGALYRCAKELGMEPLVEVNNEREMEVALRVGARVVGVNNRNLHDFVVDMGTTSRVAEGMRGREDVVLCALSGIGGPEDVRGYVGQGVGAVLVGEALMRAEDPSAFVRKLLDLPEPSIMEEEEEEEERPLVKICGIRTEEEALAAMDAGADMLGLMFAPKSKRRISLDQAQKISLAVHAARFARPVRGDLVSSTSAGSKPKSESASDLPPLPWFAAHARRLSRALREPEAPARPLLVGVFQDQPLEDVRRAVEAAQLDVVQLHGREQAEWARWVGVPVVKVFHVPASGDGDKEGERDSLRELTRPGLNQFVMLDAVKPGAVDGLSGGGGVALDWARAREVVEQGELPGVRIGVGKRGRMPIVLAGGLTVENVGEAVRTVRPWAVDVSGGVEGEGGRGKDVGKMRAFVRAAKGL